MTTTEIRETLTEVAQAVQAPPVDRLAFERRVRAERRRRTTGRALAAVATAAAVAVVGSVVVHDRGPVAPTQVATSPGAGRASAMGVAVTLVDRRLTTLVPPGEHGYGDDHTSYEELLGTGPAGVVLVDEESRLLVRRLGDDGSLGDRVLLADGQAVQRAWLDATGRFLAWVDLDNVLHLRRVSGGDDIETVPLLSQQSQLAATDGTAWVEDEGDRLSYREPDQSWEVDVKGDPRAAQLAGGVLAVTTDRGVELWHVGSGTPTEFSDLEGSIGSLSPSGRAYATYSSGSLAVLASGDEGRTWSTTPVALDADLTPMAFHWQDEDRFLVVATSRARTGNHVLLDCSVAAQECTERYDDPTGTLQIATQ